jgi:hypothetical protein
MIINYKKIVFKHETIIIPKDDRDVQVDGILLNLDYPLGTQGRGSKLL